jgi:uncharacterized protein YcbK (DUF882 family)
MSELIHSDTAIKHNINNMPDINSMDCLLELIVHVLQPLRDKVGKPIIITSGYRNWQVNKLVGGAVDVHGNPISQHCKGQAADFNIKGMSIAATIDFIKKSGIEYDQLINEFDKWVHISFNKGKNRKQCFKIN